MPLDLSGEEHELEAILKEADHRGNCLLEEAAR